MTLVIAAPLFRVDDLQDANALIAKLRDSPDPLSQYLRSRLSIPTQRLIEQHNGSDALSGPSSEALVKELNRLLKGPCLYEEARFAQVQLTTETRSLIGQNPHNGDLVRLNRILLEEAYPAEIGFQPYVGPRPFTQQDRAIFFGRDCEIADLLCLVIAHRAVLLYAQSGAGKTSLLNAGLVPALEKEGFEALPLARVRGLIPKSIDPDQVNPYVFNALMSWEKEKADPQGLASMDLARYLKNRRHPLDEDGQPCPRVMIFDQFEEFFACYPDRWREREGFFVQVAEAFKGDHLLRVLFVMREDCIAGLDTYAQLLPEGLCTRSRLERMRGEAALLAVEGPLGSTNRAFAPGVASSLVQELIEIRVEDARGQLVTVPGEFVEPVQLQAVCQNLWRKLPAGTKVITADHVEHSGDVDEALKNFYERALRTATERVDIRESELRKWFGGQLITTTGTRGTVFRGPAATGGIPNSAVDVLENQHLIRAELRAGARWYELTHDRFIRPIQESNRRWLSQRAGAEEMRQRLEARTQEWMEQDQSRERLLDEVELRAADGWLNSAEAAELGGPGEAVLAFLQASRAAVETSQREKERELKHARALAAEQERRAEAERQRAEAEALRAREQTRYARSVRRVAYGLAAVAALTFVVLLISVIQWQLAQKAEAQARIAESSAQTQRDAALEANRRLIHAQVEQLVNADPDSVPSILTSLKRDPNIVEPLLRKLWEGSGEDRKQQMRAGLALLSNESTEERLKLADWMLEQDSAREVMLLRHELEPYGHELASTLWQKAENRETQPKARLRAFAALARYDPDSPRWRTAAEDAASQILNADIPVYPIVLRLWTRALFPVRHHLHTPLVEAFRGRKGAERREVAAKILADYAADSPGILADLVMDADSRQYRVLWSAVEPVSAAVTCLAFHPVLWPAVESQRQEVIVRLNQELEKIPSPEWNDTPLDRSWGTIDAQQLQQVENAGGTVAERFALCQSMPLDEVGHVVENLRKFGYRPIRFRPFTAGKVVRVAAVWNRDGREFRLAHALPAEEVSKRDKLCRANEYLPVDVAGYRDETGSERYSVLWVKSGQPNTESISIYAGVPDATHASVWQPLRAGGLVPRTYHQLLGADGTFKSSMIWERPEVAGTRWEFRAGIESHYSGYVAQRGFQTDVHIGPRASPPSSKAAHEKQLADAENELASALPDLGASTVGLMGSPLGQGHFLAASALIPGRRLAAKPGDMNSLYRRAFAYYRLGQDEKAVADLNKYIEKTRDALYAYQYRALVHARLGKADEARKDLAEFQKRSNSVHKTAHVDALLAAYLGDDAKGTERLERAIALNPSDPAFLYDAACAYATASHIAVRSDAEKARRYANRAVALLKDAVANGYANYDHMQTDTDLDPIRQHPEFANLLLRGHLDRHYAAVWLQSAERESQETHGLTPEQHVQKCRELAAQGYRPAGISVAETREGQPLVTASVWHRPVIPETVKSIRAKRQAQGAVALLHLGKAERVWPLLQHNPDPGVWSYLIHLLASLETDPRSIKLQLEQKTSTSLRRALILSLGEYDARLMPLGVQETLAPRLLALYREDPDPGVHSAVDWLLRERWGMVEALPVVGPSAVGLMATLQGQGPFLAISSLIPGIPGRTTAEVVRRIDAELSGQSADNRHWYVNKQTQTFALIPGPVDFLMGSPESESDRSSSETLHRRRIPRSYAIATKKVTVEQFEGFLSDVGRKYPGVIKHSYAKKYSPNTDGPIIAVSWFDAAMYCRWVSEQDGIPEEQMCYPPIPQIKPGVRLPKDYLSRTGYRLPTEAEWEYACRAAALTSRFYGRSDELLGRYAWYAKNSDNHAYPVGRLKPNDFGLFDVLGNTFERCQGLSSRSSVGGQPVIDLEEVFTAPQNTDSSVLRGGPYDYIAAAQRSASSFTIPASSRSNRIGFRVARTLRP